jgi:HAD superfamily hydrolase (TIGR01509 family)
MVKAIFFDLSGVLVDCNDWHFSALNHALRDVINYEIPYEEHLQNYNGLTTTDKLEKLRNSGVSIDNDQLNSIINLKGQYTDEIIYSLSVIDQAKCNMLHYLREDFILACVTNSNRVSTEKILELSGLIEYFNFIICNEDVQNNKPSPDCYLYAIKTVQKLIPDLKPLEVLIFEDSAKGIEAAKASGANVITVSNIDHLNIKTVSAILNKLDDTP